VGVPPGVRRMTLTGTLTGPMTLDGRPGTFTGTLAGTFAPQPPPPAVRGTTGGTGAAVALPACEPGDVLVAFVAAADMLDAAGWFRRQVVPDMYGASFLQAFSRTADGTAADALAFPAEVVYRAYAVAGGAAVQAAFAHPGAGTSIVAPSVNLASAPALLLCGYFAANGAQVAVTPPAGQAAADTVAGPLGSLGAGTEVRGTAGATGTRTATTTGGAGDIWTALAVAVRA
jgi:hypothetical protein